MLGDFEAGTPVFVESLLKYAPFDYLSSNSLLRGHCLVGSLIQWSPPKV